MLYRHSQLPSRPHTGNTYTVSLSLSLCDDGEILRWTGGREKAKDDPPGGKHNLARLRLSLGRDREILCQQEQTEGGKLRTEYIKYKTFLHCKVLTANLGHILDVKGTEQGLTDFKGSSTLTFEQYRYYVHTEVFSALPDQVRQILSAFPRDR